MGINEREIRVAPSEWMQYLQESPDSFLVTDAGSDGIVLTSVRGTFCVAVVVLGDGKACLDLVPQPAWPAGALDKLREVLATVYDAEGVELWVRMARRRAWTVEYAQERAAQMRDAFA